MEINFKGPVMPIDPYSQLAFVDTQHHTHCKAYYGCEQVSHSKECESTLRLTIGIFPMVICR